LILHQYGELPTEGTTIEINGLIFEVTHVADNRIKGVVFHPKQKAGQAEKKAGEDN
jgi:CBS domain containing-hemolysin-like protein